MNSLEFVQHFLFGSGKNGDSGALSDLIAWKNRLIDPILLLYALFFFIEWITTGRTSYLAWATSSLSLSLTLMLRMVCRWPILIFDSLLCTLNLFLWWKGTLVCALAVVVCLISASIAALPHRRNVTS
jgi:hypothetical protein